MRYADKLIINWQTYFFDTLDRQVTTPWIYHNPDLWLISLSDDWENWITISDKNLWATIVYNDWDDLSEENCGWYFQWWNNYCFSFTWTVTTDNNQVDTTWYWPWNYYNDNTYIVWSNDWSSIQNDDLWWDVTDTLEARQWPCNSWYHVPTESESIALVDTLAALGIDTNSGYCMKTYLKMPFSGSLNSSAVINNQDIIAFYWSSSAYNVSHAFSLFFDSSGFLIQHGYYRANGYSVRPFKNEPVVPTLAWTAIYQSN